MSDSERLKLAIDFLRRWSKAEIPDTMWTEPHMDCLLPIETQQFLADEDSRS